MILYCDAAYDKTSTFAACGFQVNLAKGRFKSCLVYQSSDANIAELTAIRDALKKAVSERKGVEPVEIVTDSETALKWIKSPILINMKVPELATYAMGIAMEAASYVEILGDVEFRQVKGHVQNTAQDQVDRMCKDVLRKHLANN